MKIHLSVDSKMTVQIEASAANILLSFAPSAAATGHCDCARISCERNRARRSVFSSVGLCPRFSHEKCVRTSSECSPFWGTVSPIVAPQMFKKQSGMLPFFMVFSSILMSFPVRGGTPLKTCPRVNYGVNIKTTFACFCDVPGEALGLRWSPSGSLEPALGRPWAPLWRPK